MISIEEVELNAGLPIAFLGCCRQVPKFSRDSNFDMAPLVIQKTLNKILLTLI